MSSSGAAAVSRSVRPQASRIEYGPRRRDHLVHSFPDEPVIPQQLLERGVARHDSSHQLGLSLEDDVSHHGGDG